MDNSKREDAWKKALNDAQTHAKSNPLGDGKCDPSNEEWRRWRDVQRDLERKVYGLNPYTK